MVWETLSERKRNDGNLEHNKALKVEVGEKGVEAGKTGLFTSPQSTHHFY